MAVTISIVTPCLNSAEYLEETVLSVLGQAYSDLQYFVVDGGSTDGTLEILDRHRDALEIVHAPGSNQASAINEGFRRASGNILGWLNSDDVYVGKALEVAEAFFRDNPDAHFVFGDALAIDTAGREYGRRVHVRPGQLKTLVSESDFIVQPAAFWTRELWERTGPLREDLDFALDYEYWMRAARHHELHYLPHVLAKERLHGGAKTVAGGLARIEEIRAVAEAHGGDGIPMAFRPEAAAVYLLSAAKKVGALRFGEARRFLVTALENRERPLKTLAFIASMMLAGTSGVARARLWANRLRTRDRTP